MSPSPRSPAFALAAACCAWPPSEARNAEVRLASRDIDWDRFARVVARHRIEGLARGALRHADVRPPPEVDQALAAAAADIAYRSLGLAAESARLQSLLDEAAVPSLILKGAALDILAYGVLGLKRAWDIDLLVSPAMTSGACEVLGRAGYDLTRPAGLARAGWETWTALSKECVFTHRDNGVVVELHWRLVDGDALLQGLSAASPAQLVKLSGALSLRTLARDELFAYLCVHGASHGWSRLKWLADLRALIAHETPAGLDRLYRRSLELGAGLCPAQALLLCHRLLGLELATAFERELEADIKTRWLVALAIDAMTGGGETETHDRSLGAERILLARFLFAGGWRYRWAEFRRQWISLDDRLRFALPPALHFLYAVIRIPSWFWRRVFRRP